MKKFDGLNLAKREEVAVGGGEIWRVIPPNCVFHLKSGGYAWRGQTSCLFVRMGHG